MASSKAFDGFFAISGILCLAAFLLLIQLCLLHFKEGDAEWKRIVEGKRTFPTIVSRSSSKSVVHEKEGFFADMKLGFKGLEQLPKKLERGKHVYKIVVVYLDLIIIIGGCIIWVPMLVAICRGKLENLFSLGRGFFLIVIGLFFLFCGMASGIISIMSVYSADINDYYTSQSKAAKYVAEKIKSHKAAGFINLTDPGQSEQIDVIHDGKINLSPATWMLILLDCLNDEGYTIGHIMREEKISEEDIDLVYDVAITRLANSQPLTKIRGKAYSMWLLQQLHLCPNESVKQSLQGFLAIVLCGAPCVPYILWKEYGRRAKSDEPKKHKEEKDKDTVIGTNEQLSNIVDPPKSQAPGTAPEKAPSIAAPPAKATPPGAPPAKAPPPGAPPAKAPPPGAPAAAAPPKKSK